ncbi:VPS4-associated protein 1 [Pestalotiopsis sp. NC0098]|nr:VPS4-associated protein 1 [Pestalotiopsis sp. NC0098]
MSFPNVWHHRKVAESAAKGCDICYKPSTSVLVTPEKQDFFYVCPVHLKDTRFATPFFDEVATAARRKKELDEELERVKKEYEEKQKKKEEKANSDDKDKDAKADEKKDEKKDESKAKEEEKPEASTPKPEEPRVFSLAKSFYQGRLTKKHQAEVAKRNRERMATPGFFPSVPKDAP